MRFLSKGIATFTALLVLTAGAVLAQPKTSQPTRARIEQVGINMDADIEQKSSGHSGVILQGLDGKGVQKNFDACINQHGHGNTGKIVQNGDANPDADINQIGRFNKALQKQNLIGANGAESKMRAKQKGKKNYVRQTQVSPGSFTATAGSKSSVQQEGNQNITTVLQKRGKKGALISNVVQDGDRNIARIKQGFDVGEFTPSAKVKVIQTGNGNNARILQE